MEIIKAIAFAVFILGYSILLFRRKWLEEEIKRNDTFEPPSEQQLRWHIRHLREDMHTLVLLNGALLTAVMALLLLKG